MAIARAILASDEVITTTERTVTSALAQHVKVFLPPVGDGTGGTVAEGHSITITQTAEGGSINVLTNMGSHVVFCKSGASRQILAGGNAANNRWVSSDVLPTIRTSRPLAVNGTLVPALSGEIVKLQAFELPSLTAGEAKSSTHNVPGAVAGDVVTVSIDRLLGSTMIFASVDSANTVNLLHKNFNSGTGFTIAAGGTLRFVVTPITGTLPAGASLGIRGWLRRLKPDGTIGLIPLWDEVA